ncbi:hypothetical protein OAA86_09650 [Rhodospirillales bacterium]|nr:hypothetical protein [Rhodospirillales bacterium]
MLPVHSLYVGSRDGKTFSDDDRRAVIDADGYFKGCSVATLIIKIGTEDRASVEALGNELGRFLDQEAIGLETTGYYKSISMG